MKLIETIKFNTELVLERSCTSVLQPLGSHDSEMSLYHDGENRGFIEWDIPSLNEVVGIGLWFNGKELTDYDGVFSLPEQAIALLEKNGFNAEYAK